MIMILENIHFIKSLWELLDSKHKETNQITIPHIFMENQSLQMR